VLKLFYGIIYVIHNETKKLTFMNKSQVTSYEIKSCKSTTAKKTKISQEKTSSQLERILYALRFKASELHRFDDGYYPLVGRIKNIELKLQSRNQFENLSR
jgi:hypothetical protein